jgi:hypothetical protein
MTGAMIHYQGRTGQLTKWQMFLPLSPIAD